MIVKKKEQDSLLKTWITASILIHLLILLLAFFWYLQDILKQRLSFRTQEKKSIVTSTKAVPDQKKQLMAQQPMTYTLTPGKKAVTTATTTSANDLQNKESSHKEENIVKKIEDQLPKNSQSKHFIPQQIVKKEELTPLELLQKKLKKETSLNKEEKKEITSKSTKPDQDPTIQKPKVTLKDLKLGFSKFINQEGNNDLLIQHGKKEPNDPQSLKFITYNQQVARTMREAILTHDLWRNIKGQHGKRIQFSLTIDRPGKLLNVQLRQSSGDHLLDQITIEALKDIKLYPPLPKHISQEPHTMSWTLLF